MSDEQWLFEQVPQALRTYPHEYALPVEFAVLDAALWTHLNTRWPPGRRRFFFQRVPLTHGNVQYIMRALPPAQRASSLVVPGAKTPPPAPLDLMVIEVRWVMEETTYIVAIPKKAAPRFTSPEKVDLLNAFGRWILADFLRSFISDQERILSLRKDRLENAIPLNVSAKEHAVWHDRFGELAGLASVKEYAKRVGLSDQAIYNARREQGLTKPKPKKSVNQSKQKGK